MSWRSPGKARKELFDLQGEGIGGKMRREARALEDDTSGYERPNVVLWTLAAALVLAVD